MPSPIMAMMSRWTSFVPPPKVKMVWLRACCSSRPRRTAPGDPSTRVPGLTDHVEQEPIDLQGELGAVDLGGRRISRVQSLVRSPRHLPVQQLQHVDLCVRPGQEDLDPFVIDHGRARRGAGAPAPIDGHRSRLRRRPEAGQIATRSWFSWFVINFHPWFSAPTRFSAGTRTSS